MAQQGEPDSARLFFALWPDAGVRRRVAEHCPRHGRLVPPQNWHVTLVFLGGVTARVRAALEQAADAADPEAFSLSLDRRGCWRRSGIFWLAASAVPSALQRLQLQLAEAAAEMGVPRETRPYLPHLTLARKARPEPETIIDPIQWRVDEFCLVRSELLPQGARYAVLRRWPLRGGGQPG